MLSTTGAIAFGPATANLPTCGSSIPLPASPPCCNPEFGSTIDFVLFTNNGAVSNVGNSGYSRNIGSDMGVISGFATATVVGSFYNQDVVTEQTKIDLYELYNQLIINPITNNYHPPAFGNGETLTTGVYYIGGAGSLAGNLTLDAQGDTNSVFIFKIRGAFAAGANSNIILANLASSCSVFWVAEGAISIGASCQMKGTFLANNAAVSMADGGNLEGRLFSTNGAIAIDQTVADNTTPCHKPTYILPIELLSFNGKCNFQNIVLNWSTSTEINNNYFSIERSIDGINWQIIGLVNGAGNSNGLKNYTYTDDEPNNGISYYRLKQTDFNKTFKYSNIIYVENCKDGISELSISPNPVNEALNLSFYGDKNLVISMSIYNLLGEIIYFKKGYQSKIIFEEEINGVYFLHLSLPSKNIIKKFLTLN